MYVSSYREYNSILTEEPNKFLCQRNTTNAVTPLVLTAVAPLRRPAVDAHWRELSGPISGGGAVPCLGRKRLLFLFYVMFHCCCVVCVVSLFMYYLLFSFCMYFVILSMPRPRTCLAEIRSESAAELHEENLRQG